MNKETTKPIHVLSLLGQADRHMKTSKIIVIAFLLLSAVAAMAQGIDSDGDGTPDVTDYFPFNPFKTTDDWGQNV